MWATRAFDPEVGPVYHIDAGLQPVGAVAAVRYAEKFETLPDGTVVAEIATASNDQAQGINEVSQGLSQIDAVTQQNTANSEETASAAMVLSERARELQQLLAGFTLKGGSAPAPRQTPAAADFELPEADDEAPVAAPAPAADAWEDVPVAAGVPADEDIIMLDGDGWPE